MESESDHDPCAQKIENVVVNARGFGTDVL
jgi:hypothetical protein